MTPIEKAAAAAARAVEARRATAASLTKNELAAHLKTKQDEAAAAAQAVGEIGRGDGSRNCGSRGDGHRGNDERGDDGCSCDGRGGGVRIPDGRQVSIFKSISLQLIAEVSFGLAL